MVISSLDKLHYSFCSELKNNISLTCPGSGSNFSVPFPKLALFKVDTNFASNLSNSFSANNYVELKGIKFIDDLEIKKVEGESFSDIINNAFMAFIAPYDFIDAIGKKERTKDYYYDEIEGKITFQENSGQSWFKDQPHLVSHTTFQLFFLDGMLGTYNLGKMDYEIQEGKVIINYLLVIKATPSGILFKFQSGEVSPPIRWNLAVKGNIVTMRIFQAIYQGQKNLWQKIKSPLLKIIGGAAGGAVGGPAGAAAGSAAGGALAGNEKNPAGVELNRGIAEAMGLNSVKSGKASEEQHTNRMVEQVGRTSESISDPTLYYTNNIDYHFNFFDFWMRLNEWDSILVARLVFSSVLYNNLVHNNNQNPITYPLNITFPKLGMILRKGYWQGKLKLAYDPGNWLQEKFNQGITFFEDMSKDFPKPELGISQQQSTSIYSRGGFGDVYIGEEIREEGEGISVDIPYTAEQRGYSHSTFIRISGPGSVQDDFKDTVVRSCGADENSLHYDSTQGFCWGCTYDELKRKGFLSMKWTASVNCTLVMLLHAGEDNQNLQLEAGIEYEVTISETQFIFRSEGVSRIVYQKQPNQDDFSALDWSPPAGSGGDIEIPLENPEITIPEPGESEFVPEEDFTPDALEVSGGEVEIPAIEIDLPPDITQDLDNDSGQDIDPPPIEVDITQDIDHSQDQDQSQDAGDQDRGDVDPPQDLPDDDPDGD